MASLAAVIPATDGRSTRRHCVASIEAAAQPPEEIIVVDAPRKAGPAGARNEGARRATAEILVFVDSDVEVHDDAFRRIRDAFARDPDLAALFGSYDDDPGGGGLVSDFRNLLHHHVHHSSAGPATTFWAGLGAVRRDVFLAGGGFDETRYPTPSVEDIELGMRLAAGNHRIVLDPAIQGKHLKRWTLGGMIQTDLVRRGAPWVRLLLDGAGSATALNLGWRHRASAVVTIGFVFASAARKPTLAGIAFASLLWLNREFYALLYSRRGLAQTAVGIPLHMLHHLTSVLAVPIGVGQHLKPSRTPRARC